VLNNQVLNKLLNTGRFYAELWSADLSVSYWNILYSCESHTTSYKPWNLSMPLFNKALGLFTGTCMWT